MLSSGFYIYILLNILMRVGDMFITFNLAIMEELWLSNVKEGHMLIIQMLYHCYSNFSQCSVMKPRWWFIRCDVCIVIRRFLSQLENLQNVDDNLKPWQIWTDHILCDWKNWDCLSETTLHDGNDSFLIAVHTYRVSQKKGWSNLKSFFSPFIWS